MSFQPPPRRAATTTAAAVIDFVLTGLFGLLTLALIIGGIALLGSSSNANRDYPGLGTLAGAAGGALLGIGAVFAGLCAWCIVLGVKILQRKTWARWGAVATFGIFTLLSVAAATGNSTSRSTINGRTTTTSTSNGGPAIVWGLATLAVVILLILKPTSEDFRRAAEAASGTYNYGVPAYSPPGYPPPGYPPTGYPPPGYTPPGYGPPPPPPWQQGPPPGAGPPPPPPPPWSGHQ